MIRIRFHFHATVIQLNDAIEKKDGSNVPRRQIQLSSTPQMLSLSCDHTMLAVTYSMNGSAFIDFYAVQSFLSNVSIFQSTNTLKSNNFIFFVHIFRW